ncbi:MAG: hypothetical protein HQL26_09610 [Candidatus Omnitrophica bacterium]|nr:hypothetical protein [Candidatus Omnitrophota bacterium]
MTVLKIKPHAKVAAKVRGFRSVGFKHTQSCECGKFEIKKDFKALDSRTIDAKSRITLSPTWTKSISSRPIRSFQIFQNEDGDILLRPEVTIPAREAWIFENPKALASLGKGIKEIDEGKGEVVKDLDAFLKKI